MAQTKQGNFDITYPHIEAPTVQDGEWGKERKSRKLTSPSINGWGVDIYRDPLVSYLSSDDWFYKRKLNGENMRILWNGEQALWNGKTNKFVCGNELSDYMNNTFLEEIFEEKFGRDKQVLLFGEHMGEKVQGNELGLKGHHFVLFDVNINGYWLGAQNIVEIAQYFNIYSCYDFMDGTCGMHRDPLWTLIDDVANGSFEDWEGIVATPKCCTFL